MNLYSLFLEALADAVKTTDDILFIGSFDSKYECSLPEFKMMAEQLYILNAYELNCACDLVVVFNDNSHLELEKDRFGKWRMQHKVPFKRKTLLSKPIRTIESFGSDLCLTYLQDFN